MILDLLYLKLKFMALENIFFHHKQEQEQENLDFFLNIADHQRLETFFLFPAKLSMNKFLSRQLTSVAVSRKRVQSETVSES